MIRRIREWAVRLLGALEGIQMTLAAWREHGVGNPSADEISALQGRVDEMERTRALWEAEVEAELLRAQNERRNARAAEERVRYHGRQQRVDSDEGSEEGQLDALLSEGDGQAGAPERVQPMRESVAARRARLRSDATRRKFGG